MMKKSTLFTMVILMIAILISCDKDEFTEEDAFQYEKDLLEMEKAIAEQQTADAIAIEKLRDSLEHIGGIINYAVNVVNAGDAGFAKSGKKASSLWHAYVTVSQHGIVQTVETNESGIAVFPDLRIGETTVHVEVEGFTTCDYVVQLKAEWDMNDENWVKPEEWDIPIDGDYYGVLRNASTMVPLFPMQGHTMSTIKGQVTYETDLTNAEPEIAYGVEVVGVIDTDDALFREKYWSGWGNDECTDCLVSQIVSIAYGNIVARNQDTEWNYDDTYSDINVTDENGMYELHVPSTADGLPIRLVISEIARDQRLLMNQKYGEYVTGIQTVRTIFSSEVRDPEFPCGQLTSGCVTASQIPDVQAAYAIFSAPTTLEGDLGPAEDAVLDVVLAESGVYDMLIKDAGSCITQPLPFTVLQDECLDCADEVWNETAKGIANIVDGKVVSVMITEKGRGYREFTQAEINNGTTKVWFDLPSKPKASVDVTYSIEEKVYDIADMDGYDKKPGAYVTSDAGSGAVAEAISTMYLDEIEVTAKGTMYTETPDILIKGGDPMDAAWAWANMSTKNPIHSIMNVGVDYIFTEAPQIIAYNDNLGNEQDPSAKIVAKLAATGGVAKIHVNDGGLGYSNHVDSLPTIEITGDGFGATAHAKVENGMITEIIVDEPGMNYTAATVTISKAYDTPYIIARDASATAMVGKKIAKFNVIDNGSGYIKDETTIKLVCRGVDNVDDPATPGVEVEKVITDDVEIVYDMYIESITVGNNGGHGYKTKPEVLIVAADPYGSNATAEAVMKYRVTHVEITDGGQGYRSENGNTDENTNDTWDGEQAIVVYESTDNPQVAYLFVDDDLHYGELEFTMLSKGSGYYAQPIAYAIDKDGDIVADLKAEIHANQISALSVDNYRANITPDMEIDLNGVPDYPNVENGQFEVKVDTYCTLPDLMPVNTPNAGQIVAINVTNPGRGYHDGAALVRIFNTDANGNEIIVDNNGNDAYGPGSDAAAHVMMVDGRIMEIVVDNPGHGYVINNKFGVKAEIVVPTQFETAVGVPVIDQGRIVDVDFANGGIWTQMLTPGEGYDTNNPPTVTFYPAVPGKGKDAKGYCVVGNDGKIMKVVMTNQGSGYYGKNRYANVINDATGTLTDYANAGKGFVVTPYFGNNGTYNPPSGAYSPASGKMVTEAGKTYVKDMYLGTGKRTTDMQP